VGVAETVKSFLSGLSMAKKYAPSEIEHHLKYEIDMLNGSYALIDNIDALLDAGNADAIQRQVAVNALKAYPFPSGMINILYVMGFAARPIARSERKAA
jgi:hypothetical protein